MQDTPTYDLQLLQQLVGQGQVSRLITQAAMDGGAPLDCGTEEIVEAVLILTAGDFYKTMQSGRIPGLWQDVYHLEYRGVHVYVKLQMGFDGRAHVVQFKQK
ncbi:MAG TPA: type II toxin-antitoxin system MqsR family toxin [Longimicrobium sp.]|nr:type II toxin-antitoxin system MqsR family toxin [Longimicrobium sp.]